MLITEGQFKGDVAVTLVPICSIFSLPVFPFAQFKGTVAPIRATAVYYFHYKNPPFHI